MNLQRHRRKRAFTLIELLVVVAILGILAALLIPNVICTFGSGKKSADAVNLKRLFETYLSGQAQAKARRTPRAVGHQFWLALCVGDGPGAGNLEIDGNDDPDQYIGPGDMAGLGVSPADLDALTQGEVRMELQRAIDAGTGVAGLPDSDLMCSYAGPADIRSAIRIKDAIVGCTTARDGHSIFDDGFNAVTSSAQVRFYAFRDMPDTFGWPEGVDAPLFGQTPLDGVVR